MGRGEENERKERGDAAWGEEPWKEDGGSEWADCLTIADNVVGDRWLNTDDEDYEARLKKGEIDQGCRLPDVWG